MNISALEERLTKYWYNDDFDKLTLHYQKKIWYSIKNMDSSLSHYDIDDIFQNVLKRIFFDKRYNYSFGSFSSYAITLAKWETKDYLRNKFKEIPMDYSDILELIEKKPSEEELPNKIIEYLNRLFHFEITIQESDSYSIIYILIYLILLEGGKPHQVLAFNFSSLLYPAMLFTKGSCPSLVVKSISDKTLIEITKLNNQAFAEYLEEQIPRDLKRKFYKRIINITKNILSDYYSAHPVDNVTNWSKRVKDRVKKKMITKYDNLLKQNYPYLSEKGD